MPIVLTILLLLNTSFVFAMQHISIPYQGIYLDAKLSVPSGHAIRDNMVVITHGTLAHNDMALIQDLQSLLADEGINSLAINLSLGITHRQGHYNCSHPHRHHHTDAVGELYAWIQWLHQQGITHPILLGHSRGGNQTALFTKTYPQAVKAQILIAPMTWSQRQIERDYQQHYSHPLPELLMHAQQSKEQWLDVPGFLHCHNAQVQATSFLSYYQAHTDLDTPTLLHTVSLPTFVISGSEDTIVPDLAKQVTVINNPWVSHTKIEGAGHFFRDLYTDEVVEHITTWMMQLR